MESQPPPSVSPPPPSNQENSSRPLVMQHHQAQDPLPPNVDINSSIALFKLFLPDSMWEVVVKNTNDYAAAQRCSPSTAEHQRPWKPVSINDVMIFVGALIYMDVHKEPRIDYYWRNEAPFHAIPKYMGLIRFEQIKRYLRIDGTRSFPTDIRSRHPLEINSAVVNAHKLRCSQRRDQGLRPMSQLAFREKLYVELLRYNSDRKAPPAPAPQAPATKRRKRKASDIQLPPQRLDRSLPHTLRQRPMNDRAPCLWCSFACLQQPPSNTKPKKASYIGWDCADCKVPVCHPRSGRLCWSNLHCVPDRSLHSCN